MPPIRGASLTTPDRSAGGVFLKWFSLLLMLVQNASFVLVMRYSRQQQAACLSTRTYTPESHACIRLQRLRRHSANPTP